MEDNVTERIHGCTRGQTFTSSLGRQSCFSGRERRIFPAARKPQGQTAFHARRKRPETFELLPYRVYVFLRSFREARRGCTSVCTRSLYPCRGMSTVGRRISTYRRAHHPILSSRTIVKPPLSGHTNTLTSVLSSTREVDTSLNPSSPRRTFVILNNERWNRD